MLQALYLCYIYISWEPVDIVPTDRDEIEEEDDKWDDNLTNELEKNFEELRRFNATFETSSDKDVEKNITLDKLDRIKKLRDELLNKSIKSEPGINCKILR